MRDRSRDRSLSESLKCETSSNIEHGNHEEFKFESESEIDQVEDERDCMGGDEEDVCAESAQTDETDDQPG